MNDFISNDLDFLLRLMKKLWSQNIKWSSDVSKLFPNDSIERTFSEDSGLMDSQVKYLHECCVDRNLKIILIDLDDGLNCTIIGELEPLSRSVIEDPFNHTPPMILLRRLTKKVFAGPGSCSSKIPEYYHVPLYKIIQLKGRKDIQLLYLFNKIQYIRMKTLVSNGMAPVSNDGFKDTSTIPFLDENCSELIWKFDRNDSQSDQIKERLDLHFSACTTTPATSTPMATTPMATTSTTITSTTTSPTKTSPTAGPMAAPTTTTASLATTSTTTTPTTTTATSSPSKIASLSPKAITETEKIVTSIVEKSSKTDSDKNEDDDDDEVIFRRPGWKRKRPKFELESFKPKKKIKLAEENYERKRTKFEVQLSQAIDKTYKCKVFKCGKTFTSWAQFNKHEDTHSTICKYCYKVFKTVWGCADHSKTCAEHHKPRPRLSECTTTPTAATTTPSINSPTATTSTTTTIPVINLTTDSPIVVSNSVETNKENVPKVVERQSEHDDGEDDDVLIIRRTGGKQKQPKLEQENSLKTKKKNKFDSILSQANDETYKCDMPQCGKKFSSWAHFDKHQNDHRTQCKDCYKIFSNKKGLDTHLMDCSERHKPKPKVYECQICYKEFITELQLKLHVESAHQKKEFVDLAENLKSKIAESKRRKEKKRKSKLRKKRHEMVLNQSSQAAGMSAEPTADVIEISDDEDGEVVCKPGCDCVVCNGLGKYFCK